MTSTEAATAAARPLGSRPRLVFFYSPRGGESRRVERHLAYVLQRRQNHQTFELSRVDADERGDLVERFRIARVPTLLVVEDRRISARIQAPRTAKEIADRLGPWLR